MANTLCPPTVVGPISPCNREVRVQNQLINSTVTILRNGTAIVSQQVNWPDFTIPLPANISLNFNDAITATQTVGTVTSPQSPQPVYVQSTPQALGSVTFLGPVLECASALLVGGAVPGAQITIVDQHGNQRGQDTASQDGSVGVQIQPPLAQAESVNASQTACGLNQAAPGTLSPAPLSLPASLPRPIIQQPLAACDEAVTISEVVPGALVTLKINQQPPFNESTGFLVSSEYLMVPSLSQGQHVTAVQAFPGDCNKTSLSDGVIVHPARAPSAPVLSVPPCPGAQWVRLAGLTVGNLVEIFEFGALIGRAQAALPTDDFFLPRKLRAGALIWAVQGNQCPSTKWSPRSNRVGVPQVAPPLQGPQVQGPLYECSTVVPVTNITPGALVQVHSQLNGIIGQTIVYSTDDVISVAPQLANEDMIWASQSVCNLGPSYSPKVPVQRPGSFPVPVVLPLRAAATAVEVTHVLPGSIIDVTIQVGGSGVAQWLTSGIAAGAVVTLPIPPWQTLSPGDVLVATARLCNQPLSSNPTVVSPNILKLVYVVNNGSNNVSAYTIGQNGVLTPVIGSPYPAGQNPAGIAVDPTGQFAYVVTSGDSSVSVYNINADGSLGTPVASYPTGHTPAAVTVDPTGQFVYVVNAGSKDISAYTIGAYGLLTPMGGPATGTGTDPQSVTASGNFLYVANTLDNNVSVFMIGQLGGLTQVAGSPFKTGISPISVAVDPSGPFAYVANSADNSVWAYTVDAMGGLTQTPMGGPAAGTGTNPTSVTVNPLEKVAYVTNAGASPPTVWTYAIDAHGVLTQVSGPPINAGTLTGMYPNSIAVDPSGQFVFVANSVDNTVSAYTIVSGVLTQVRGSPYLTGGQNPTSVVAIDT